MRIDLNADLGEECGDDAAIFPCLSSANIACGAHAGGGAAMVAALHMAAECDVVIGAHVSYEDRANFGRIPVDIASEALASSLCDQIMRLQDAAADVGLIVRYVKPHGALYHRVAIDPLHADALSAAIQTCDPNLELLVPESPVLRDRARGIPLRHEFFADRAYTGSGELVGRSDARAHIADVAAIVERTRVWLRTGNVASVDGTALPIAAQSICLHGDSLGAVEAALALREALRIDGYRIANWLLP